MYVIGGQTINVGTEHKLKISFKEICAKEERSYKAKAKL